MYKLEFTLKQHTPLIHFQHDQDRATLRATEVKPKLDRFIMTKLGDGNYSIGLQKAKINGWLIGNGEHPALDYKMRVEDLGSSTSLPIDYEETNDTKFRPRFPFVFGNLEKESDKKVFKFSESIKLILVLNSLTLKKAVDELISEFFLFHNFGFRQSKGFGCFTILNKYSYKDSAYSFTVKLKKSSTMMNKYQLLFESTELLYKTLRSGINAKGIYFKSMMFMYAKSETYMEQWDKRTIREKLYSSHETYRRVKTNRTDRNATVHYRAPNQNSLLFRDMLGLSTEQDWMNYGKEKKDKEGNPIFKNGKKVFLTDKISKKSVKETIDRFGSPILFKPIIINEETFRVYIIPNLIPESFLNHSFLVKSTSYPGNSFTAKTPESFNTLDFLDFCFKRCFPTDVEMQKHIQGDIKREEAQTLIRIYAELRKSK